MDFEPDARPREWQLTRDFGRGAGPRKTGAERSPEPVRGEDRRAVPGVGRRKEQPVRLAMEPAAGGVWRRGEARRS